MPQPKTAELEKKRFREYYRIYAKNSPAVGAIAQQQATAAAPSMLSGSTNSAKAQKTMETRKGIHGQKTMTDSGVQKVKDAGKQRTQSQPKL